jgi:hypothetical protein
MLIKIDEGTTVHLLATFLLKLSHVLPDLGEMNGACLGT